MSTYPHLRSWLGRTVYSLILVALSSTVCTLVAQSNPGRRTYSGVVLDATSQEPLIGASLWVEELHQGVATDADGAFTLSLPTKGEYHIKVSYVGYKDYTLRYSSKRASQAPQRILLSSSTAELGTVFVHGKGQAQRLREIPSSITVIDTRELRGTVSSLNEVLNRSMGVKVTSTGGIGSTSRMIIQGLDGKRIAIFVNGVPIGSSDQTSLDAFAVDQIDHVEVYKGIIPSWLGGEGLGGAINIILRHEELQDHLTASYEVGSFHTHKGSLRANKYLPALGLNLSLALQGLYTDNDYTFDSPFEHGLVVRRDHDTYASYGGSLSLSLHKPWIDHLSLSLGADRTYQEIQGGVLNLQNNIQHAHTHTTNLQGALSVAKSILDGKLYLSLTSIVAYQLLNHVDTSHYCYDFAGRTFPSGSGQGEIGSMPNDSHDQLINIQEQLNLRYQLSPAHRLLGNISYRFARRDPHDELASKHTKFAVSGYPGQIHSLITGLTHEWKLWDERITNELGVKHVYFYSSVSPLGFTIYEQDHAPLTSSRSVWGGSEAISIKALPNLTLKGSTQYTMRTPRAEEIIGDGVLIYPSPKLAPERSLNFNLGVNWLCNPDDYPNCRIDLNGYYMNVKDMIKLVMESLIMKYTNFGQVRIAGVEAELYANLFPWLTIRSNITYQDARDKMRTAIGGGQNFHYNYRVPNMPYLFGNAEIRLQGDQLLLSDDHGEGFIACEYTAPFSYGWEASKVSRLQVPRRWNFNVGVQYTLFQHYHLALEVNNLFDTKQWAEYQYPLPTRSLRAKLKVTF